MRISNPAVSRPHYYDRAGDPQIITYEAIVAPHGSTVRATYTVPAGKKAFVELAMASFYRETAAGTSDMIGASARFNTADGQTANILAVEQDLGTKGQSERIAVGGSGLIVAGEAVDITTQDQSTTGTVLFRASVKMTEFDA